MRYEGVRVVQALRGAARGGGGKDADSNPPPRILPPRTRRARLQEKGLEYRSERVSFERCVGGERGPVGPSAPFVRGQEARGACRSTIS